MAEVEAVLDRGTWASEGKAKSIEDGSKAYRDHSCRRCQDGLLVSFGEFVLSGPVSEETARKRGVCYRGETQLKFAASSMLPCPR